MRREEVSEPLEGDGCAVAGPGGLGEGYGFPAIRRCVPAGGCAGSGRPGDPDAADPAAASR